MEIPKVIDMVDCNPKYCLLKIKINVYSQKQAGRVWNKYLVKKMESIRFDRSKYDECVFYKNEIVYLLNTDDTIMTGPDKK